MYKRQTQLPNIASILPSSAAFLVKVPVKLYVRNNIKEITIGSPNPPLRINAPNGAPTKNNIIDVKANEYLSKRFDL